VCWGVYDIYVAKYAIGFFLIIVNGIGLGMNLDTLSKFNR